MSRIVVVTEQMVSPHGTQALAALVIDQAVRAGHEVGLYTAYYRPDASHWATFLRERAVRVHHPGFWKLTRWHLPHRVIAARLWRDVRREPPALVWSPDNEPLTCQVLRRRPPGSPPVLVHDPSEASPLYPHYPREWFELCHRVDGLSVHGERQRAAARRHCDVRAPIGVVWPGCEAPGRISPNRPAPRLRFGLLGRLHEGKGVDVALRALALLTREGVDACLHVHGDGPERGKLDALTHELDLSERVTFHGAYRWRDLDRVISGHHVGLMPSRYEGFGLVMLEHLARGRAMIATDVGSAREVLESLGGGWVVPRDDPAALAEAMSDCARDPEAVRAHGRIGREVWRRHFTPEAMFARYEAFWRRCGVAL